MCTERKNQIIRELEANLPSDFKYTNNYELEEGLDKIVQGMCEIVFEKTHAECRTVKDLKDIIWQITYDSKDVDERLILSIMVGIFSSNRLSPMLPWLMPHSIASS